MLNADDKQLLAELSLSELPEENQAEQVRKFYETLEVRVGMALERKLTEEQLTEFEQIHQTGDEEAAISWLRNAVPDYEDVVSAETAALKQEIIETTAEFKKILDETDKN